MSRSKPRLEQCLAAIARTLLFGFALTTAAAAESAAPPATYVGAATCGSCHSGQLELWRGSHHDLAMDTAREDTVLGNFADAQLSHQGITSRFFRKDGKYFVHTAGSDGELHDFEVKYTFGVEPLQQYLLDTGSGRLQAFTVAWDTRPRDAGGQRWYDLQADEKVTSGDPLHWSGPFYNWNARCASCHSTNLRKNFDLAGRTYNTTWSEIDVGCEACHGPGSAHVAWAAVSPTERAAANGLEVALEDADAELDTCAPCHSRRHAITDVPQPGAPFLDGFGPELLRAGLYFADGQIDDEVYDYGSFVQSKMNAAGVRCKDCHDPHSLHLRAEGNALCTQCHNPAGNARFPTLRAGTYDDPGHHHHEAGSAGARCVSCHMPERTYMVLDGRRDHSFRVPRPDLSAAHGVPNACNSCHAEKPASWAAAAVAQWFGDQRAPHWTAAIAAGRAGQPEALALLESTAANSTQPALVRATAVELLQGFGPRGTAAALALTGDESPLVRAAAARAMVGIPPAARLQGASLLSDPRRSVRIEAARLLADVPRELLGPEGGQALEAALDEYRAAQNANLDTPEAHLNLALLHTTLGELDDARRAYETAIDIGPYFIPAYVNLADLYRATDREKEAEETLRRALAVDAENADVSHALGLSLVRRRRTEEGVAALGRAAALAPATARYAYTYGIALHSTGKSAESTAVLQKAYERHPADIDILSALVSIHREHREFGDALLFARKLQQLVPADPKVGALVQALEAEQIAQPAAAPTPR